MALAVLGTAACATDGAPETHRRLDQLADALDRLATTIARGSLVPATPRVRKEVDPATIIALGETAPRYGRRDAPLEGVFVFELGDPYSARLAPKLEWIEARMPGVLAVRLLHYVRVPERSALAGRAMCAAAAQDQAFPFLRAVFATRGQGAGLDRDAAVALARDLGLDMTAFEITMDGAACAARDGQVAGSLRAAGVVAPPGLWLGRERVTGAISAEDLAKRVAEVAASGRTR